MIFVTFFDYISGFVLRWKQVEGGTEDHPQSESQQLNCTSNNLLPPLKLTAVVAVVVTD